MLQSFWFAYNGAHQWLNPDDEAENLIVRGGCSFIS